MRSMRPVRRCRLLRSQSEVKRTCVFALHMSAFDPKRTLAVDLLGSPSSWSARYATIWMRGAVHTTDATISIIRAFSRFALKGICHPIPSCVARKVAISLKFVRGLSSVTMRRSSMSSRQIVGVNLHSFVLCWHPHHAPHASMSQCDSNMNGHCGNDNRAIVSGQSWKLPLVVKRDDPPSSFLAT